MTWAEVGKVPLCLLTPDMQNRRIIDGLLRSAGQEPSPTLESNSMIVLFAHVRTGKWASIMPAKLAETLGLTDNVRSIPIVEPAATHAVGLVVPHREPMTPLIAALVAEARVACQAVRAGAGSRCEDERERNRAAQKNGRENLTKKSRSAHRHP